MRSAAIVGLVMVVGCMESPVATPVQQASPQVQAEATPVAAPDEAKAAPAIPELSEEDKRLIAADPKTLSPEDLRKRGYAMRRKIMQNPDSPAARTLKDMEEAVRNGEIQPPDLKQKKEYPTLSLPGTQPTGGRPPAGTRPDEAETPDAPQGGAE
jgi:hypothetical protein